MGTRKRPARALRATVLAVTMSVVAGAVSVVTAMPVAAALPQEAALRDALAGWIGGLSGLDGLDDLAQAVPFTDALPTGPDGLDLADAVTQLSSALTAIGDPTEQAVEDALNGLDGTTLGSATLHVDADVAGTSVSFAELRLTADRTIPLDVDEGVVSLDGIDLAVSFELALAAPSGDPLSFAYDAVNGLAITGAPTGTFRMSAGTDIASGVEVNLGILKADVVGTGSGTGDDVAIDAELAVDWVDPDGTAPITQTEWQNTAAIDLWDVSCSSATADLHVALQSDFTGAAQATVDVSDDVCDGLQIEESDVSLGDLAPFTNLSAFDAVNAIAQFAQTLRTMQFSAGSVRSIQSSNPAIPDDLVSGIPFLDQDLPNLVDVSQKLQQFFVDNGISTAEAPFDLGFGDEESVDIDQLEDALVAAGLGSIQEIIDKLGTTLGADLGLDYDSTSQTISFDYPITTPAPSTTEFTDGQGTDDVGFDFGDRLLGAGLRGVQATSSASLSVDASYTADIGVGIDLRDGEVLDPGDGIPDLTERVFVETDGVELGADVLVEGNADLVGSIGLLGVRLGSAGTVDILGRADSGAPMISIDLQSEDDTLTLREVLDGLMAVEDAETALTGTNQLEISLGPAGSPVGKVVGTLNAAVPETTLAATASIGETDLAGANVTFGWSDVTDPGSLTLTTDAAFNDDFLSFNLDTEDPLALLTQILSAVDAGLKQLDALLEQDLLDTQIPVVGTSAGELFTQLQAIRQEILAIVEDPAGSLDLLEAQIELAIAEALGITGAPEIPDPGDFFNDPDTVPESGDEVFNSASYEAAFTQWATVDLPAFLADKADFLTFGYEPGNSPGALTVGLNLGICSAADQAPDGYLCQHEAPIERSFELSLADLGVPDLGGVIGTDGDFSFALDYFLGARLDFGVELPEVTSSASGLPDVTGAPRVFIADTSGIQANVAGAVSGEFGGRLGPFGIQVGDTGGSPETGDDCTNNTDDDGDTVVNDGCLQVGALVESGEQCSNDTDDDPEVDGDDNPAPDVAVNDGCPAVASPFLAEAGVALSVGKPGATGDRVYLDDLSSFFGAVDFDALPSADCTGTDTYACATLPFFLTEEGADPIYLATLGIDVPDFTNLSGATVTGGTELATALAAEAKQLLWRLIGEGLGEVGDYVEDALTTASHDVDIPLIGDTLDAGAGIATAFNTHLVDPAEAFLATFDPTLVSDVEAGLQTFLYDTLTGAGLTLGDLDGSGGPTVGDVMVDARCGGSACADGGSVFEVDRLDVAFTIGDEIVDGQIPFDFGFPGLRLASNDPINTAVSWNLDVGFGLSADRGFYLVTDRSQIMGGALSNRPELAIDATLDVPGNGIDPADAPALEGDLSFIKIEGRDEANAPELTVAVGLDIEGPTDGRLGFEDIAELDADPSVTGTLDISWKLATAIDFGTGEDDNFPQLLADLDVHWGLGANLDDGLEVGDLSFGLNDVSIDLGSYADFLGEALKEVQRYLKPLQPIIDVVNAPIPGISDLAELVGLDPVTLITLLEAVADNDLTLLKRVLSLVSFVNSVGSIDGGIVNFGDLGLNSASLLAPELPSTQKDSLIDDATTNVDDDNLMDDFTAGGATLTQQKDEGGFSFPVLDDPSKLFNILLGKDETLVHFDAGKLSAWASANWTFGPIAVGPIPLSINVSVGGGVEGHFAVGYDTKGIRELVRIISDGDTSNDGFWTGVGALFAGIFLDDLDKTGADVPEIRLTLEGAVGAAVDLVIVSAGVEAGLRSTLDMNLHDGGFVEPIPAENLDGKLRIDEIVTFRHNPICIFDVSGRIEAFIRLFVEIDLFLFSKKFSKTIVNIVLLELENITAELCDPPDPVLATDVGGGVLRLNMGPHADDRNFAEEEPDERFDVRRVKASDPDLVQVTAFGYVQEFDGVTKVIADGGPGGDSIKFLEGGEQTETDGTLGSTIIPFDIPTVACGGAGDDTLVGGAVADHLGGDGALSGTDSCTAGEDLVADPDMDGGDTLVGNEGDDVLRGHGGTDDLSGGDGDDDADAGTGDDRLTGDEGKDILRGGPEDAGGTTDVDDILGGPEAEPATGAPADAAKDVVHGGDDIDTIEGDWGPDELHGGPDADIVVGGHGDDAINGDGGEDRLFGNEDDDVVHGDADDDLVNGSAGDDELHGDAGDDNVIGGDGGDEVHGGDGWDVLLGDNGEVNRALDPGTSSFAVFPTTGTDGLTNGLVDLLADDPAGLTGDPGEDTMSGGADPDRIYGQELDDDLHGDGGDDEMHGATGADTMSGDAGGDVMFGDADDDTMHGDDATGSNVCDDDIDTMRGGPGVDTMEGNADGDNMWGDSGRDVMYGDADTAGTCDGADAMFGGQDGDLMFGNGGGDAMDGGHDVDRMAGGSDDSGPADGADVMLGQDGDDVMAGDNATIADDPDGAPLDSAAMLVTLRDDGQGTGDTMSGGVGQDRMFGQVGVDVMAGDAADDYVEGNQGADEISGGAGDDDLIGGSSAVDGVIDDDRDGNDVDDVGDAIDGGDGTDWIAGDNALISRSFPVEGRAPIELFDLATTEDVTAGDGDGGEDEIDGGDGPDRIFGQTANDTIHGDAGTDYVEGGDGDDSIHGDGEDDDLIGGGSANDGVIDDDRIGDTLLDGGETLISGGEGEDYITGDNALVNRNVPSSLPDEIEIQLFDVATVDDDPADPATSGADTIQGDAGPDWMFGQGADDGIEGGAGDDYVEGNEGDDAIQGQEDDDDLVGGSSADDGVIDWDRRGDGLRDGGETLISGGPGVDWITGDNALVNRNRPAQGPEPEDTRAPVELFDVQVAGGDDISAETSGGDFVDGGADEDRIFAQGNGHQPASETDPADGRNNDFIGSAPGDPDFDRSTADAAALDEDGPSWTGDIVHGGTGDDEIEGGHGNDVLFGNAPGEGADPDDDEDDIVGGGSADDGVIDDDRLNRGANLLDGRDVVHGDGGDATTGDDDVVLGDNGWVVRTGDTEGGEGPDGVVLSVPNRDIRATEVATPVGTFGADHVIGNGGHDDLVGQGGDDAIDGEYGSDAAVGDLGRVTVDLVVTGDGSELCGANQVIQPEQPFYEREVCEPGTLFRRVELFAFEDTAPGVVAGSDVILGGDGDDWIHGGAGADLLQGDGDGGAEVPDPDFTYTQTITDPNPASLDEDRIFGGDSNGTGTAAATTLGNGDAIWGGRGPDFLYGGDGADNIDIRPPSSDSPYPATWTAWAQVDVESYHGIDHSWGGFDRDAVQSNVAGNGPVPGDRVVDWVGVYNLSLLCPATYGSYITIRAQSPEEIAFWEKSAAADGAFQPLDKGSSGYEDLSMVYKPDIKANNGKAYPSTPGHFFSCAP